MTDNPIDPLREHLAALHAELERAVAIAPEERDLVGRLMTDVIDSMGVQPSPAARYHSLQERLRDQARKFESRHPTLAGAIERIADMLAGAGI